ncbi:MAG: hypothetical protein R3E96_02905 [Planctomycetota bacterium]
MAEAMPAGSSFWQIWGRMRAASASTVGTAFLIDSSTLHDRTNPDVGGDVFNASVSYFCAVWEKDYGDGSRSGIRPDRWNRGFLRQSERRSM